ncbi:unnamed protein product [Hermetia illucens]|uniref:Uncharacterized protein n=1 Tax=Hermetia illucens TaxID=343691 RepID=A0A7R8UBL3_HERIL|nr:unnamed protein product [Hermetia illucens]
MINISIVALYLFKKFNIRVSQVTENTWRAFSNERISTFSSHHHLCTCEELRCTLYAVAHLQAMVFTCTAATRYHSPSLAQMALLLSRRTKSAIVRAVDSARRDCSKCAFSGRKPPQRDRKHSSLLEARDEAKIPGIRNLIGPTNVPL